jgi:ABC-type dipeptide/oligopeptide/nickel transport system ATPase subunit
VTLTIECTKVRKNYGRTVALHGASLALEGTDMLGIVGESGSGKSTLGKIIVGLEAPSAGQILVDGVDLGYVLRNPKTRRRYWQRVQLIGQDTVSTFDPRHTLRSSLRSPAQWLQGMTKQQADKAVEAIVEELGIDRGLLDRMPTELSGGQRQRMSIARALVVRPELIVADESVSALDVSVQAAVLNLLKGYCRDNRAGLVFISHGLPATAFITEQLIVMSNGRIVERGTTAEVLASPQDPFTKELLSAYRGDT